MPQAWGATGTTCRRTALTCKPERALSNFDVRNKLLVNYTYEFPLGEQRHFLNRGGVAANVLGNWQISGVTTVQSGLPLTAQVAGQPIQQQRVGRVRLRTSRCHGPACRSAALGPDDAGFLQHRGVRASRFRPVGHGGAQHHYRPRHGEFQHVAWGDSLPSRGKRTCGRGSASMPTTSSIIRITAALPPTSTRRISAG